MLPLKFACEKMWVYWRIPNGIWYFIWKILTGESHQARLTLFPQYSRYSEQSTQASFIMKLQLNGLTLTELSLAFIEQQPL
jgi:hypothetical protein